MFGFSETVDLQLHGMLLFLDGLNDGGLNFRLLKVGHGRQLLRLILKLADLLPDNLRHFLFYRRGEDGRLVLSGQLGAAGHLLRCESQFRRKLRL